MRPLLLAALLALAVAAAGCGGSKETSARAAYQARLETAFRTEERGASILRGGSAGDTVKAQVRRSVAGAALFRRAAQELSSSKPPADAAADTAALAAYMRALAAGEMNGVKLALKQTAEGKRVSLSAAEKAFNTPAFERLRRRAGAADRDLSAKGYGFKLSGSEG